MKSIPDDPVLSAKIRNEKANRKKILLVILE